MAGYRHILDTFLLITSGEVQDVVIWVKEVLERPHRMHESRPNCKVDQHTKSPQNAGMKA